MIFSYSLPLLAIIVRILIPHRWLFIIEGSITVFVALCSSFIIPDFPHTTPWLSKEERALATKRLEHTNGSHDTERGSMWGGIKMAVLDYKVWLLA